MNNQIKKLRMPKPKITQVYLNDLYDEYRTLMSYKSVQEQLEVPFYKIEETERNIANVASLITDVELMTINPSIPLLDEDTGKPIQLIRSYRDA